MTAVPQPDPGQVQRANDANRAAWRGVGITALMFLLVGFVPFLGWFVAATGLLVVPVMMTAVAVGNTRRTRAAVEGRYDETVAGAGLDARTLQARTWAAVLVAAGLIALIPTGGHAWPFTAICVLAALALRPWRNAR